MKVPAVKLKAAALVVLTAWSIIGFAQVKTPMVIVAQNNSVVFESPVSGVDSILVKEITLVMQNKVYGKKFTDKTTGKSIFLPAAGQRDENGSSNNFGYNGSYWSSSEHSGAEGISWFLSIGSGADLYGNNRSRGYRIRPVAE